MILSEKYQLKEDKWNLTLSEKKVKKEGKSKGDSYWKEVAYFSPSQIGRVQAYHRVLNLEISDLEKQGIKEILKVIEDISNNFSSLVEGTVRN